LQQSIIERETSIYAVCNMGCKTGRPRIYDVFIVFI